eukprot:scpid73186/ scgid13254/ 
MNRLAVSVLSLLLLQLAFVNAHASNAHQREDGGDQQHDKKLDGDHDMYDHAEKHNVNVPCGVNMSQCVSSDNSSMMPLTVNWMTKGGTNTFEAAWSEDSTELMECKADSSITDFVKNIFNKIKDTVKNRNKRQEPMNTIDKGSVLLNAEHLAHVDDGMACCFVLPYAAQQWKACNYNATASNCCKELQMVIDGRSSATRLSVSVFSVLAVAFMINFL